MAEFIASGASESAPAPPSTPTNRRVSAESYDSDYGTTGAPKLPDGLQTPHSDGARTSAQPEARSASNASGKSVVSRSSSGRGRKTAISDFFIGPLLGEGAYARVHVCKLKSTGDHYALKVMEKRFILKEQKTDFVIMEKKVLSQFEHRNVMRLYYSFHDRKHLYMVMDLCRGGELLRVIRHYADLESAAGRPDRACALADARFYLGETVHAVQYLHSQGIIHRDLKPENVLLCADGHIKVTDFGTAKDERNPGQRHNTFCGTAEYVSPEVLQDKEASVGADLWALGCLAFQLLIGRPPFQAESEYLTFQAILNHPLPLEDGRRGIFFPRIKGQDSIDPDAIDLINRLLAPEPRERIGAGAGLSPPGSVAQAVAEVSAEEEEEGRLQGSKASQETAAQADAAAAVRDNGPAVLRAHPFFAGLLDSPDGIERMAAPPLPFPVSTPAATMDGASDEWMLAGDATELREFLNEGERVMFDGVVHKRKGLFSHTRHLILTDRPRLFYIDPAKMVFKGEIPFCDADRPDDLAVLIKSNRKSFDVYTPKRTYHLTDLMGSAQRWADAINKAKDAMR